MPKKKKKQCLLTSASSFFFSPHFSSFSSLSRSPFFSNPISIPPPLMDSKMASAVVIITAVISFSLSGLLFFSIHRFLGKRRKSLLLIYLKNPLPASQFPNIDPKRCYYCNKLLKQSSNLEENLPPVALDDVVKSMPEAPPPPPPPPPVKFPAGFLRPPAVGEGGKEKPRFKPLHWDKVTPANAGESMVWDKIADGSTGYVSRFEIRYIHTTLYHLFYISKTQNLNASSIPHYFTSFSKIPLYP